ncbi:MAG: DUF1365 domain-containing protein [Pseudomonadota bacterium]|nr:DUF1365 domain-containing protein [Pseudomonadota bacterium]
MTNRMKSGIFWGKVVHQRLRPSRHRLSYRVFSLLLEVDQLETIARQNRLFAYNQKGIFSVWDSDHGDRSPILKGVNLELSKAGLEHCNEKILMLCYPRILNYVFNPLTVYFCYQTDGVLGAIIYEVHNTFKERIAYVLPVEKNTEKTIRQKCKKNLYVSPFLPMDCIYYFHIQPPSEKISVVIREEDSKGHVLTAAFSGDYSTLNDSTLARAAIRYPLMTLKVIVGIHLEAFRLFLKRVPHFSHSYSTKNLNIEEN